MYIAEWIAAGREAILQLLDKEHAVVWPEVEAKIADHVWQPLGLKVQPHHLTTARQQLRSEKVIKETAATTRGGRLISVVHLADLTRRRRPFEKAAARKRLLHARYLRWAVGLNLLGPAGEKVVHASLMDVAPALGYRVERPEGGPVAVLFGAPVPGGPLDDAAHLQVTNDQGVTVGTVTIPIEVKNVREWIYPDSERLHQLLYKAARLQEMHPDVAIVPLLACRRAAYTTFKMAKAFGFYVADARAQFVPRRADVTPTQVEQVAAGLGFSDLAQGEAPHPLLRSHFRRSLPSVVARAAGNWATWGPTFVDQFKQLRGKLSRRERARISDELDRAARTILEEEEWEPEPEPDSHPPEHVAYLDY